MIEMLTSIAIIAVLAGLSLGVVGKMRGIADGAKCLSNLKTIGVAISTYTSENNGLYPGPINGGQKIYYDSKMLSGFLYPYLGEASSSPAADTVVKTFICPAWARVVKTPKKSDNVVCYVVNNSIGSDKFNVWGYPTQSSPQPVAAAISRIGSTNNLSSPSAATPTFSMSQTMMISDADQLNWKFDSTAGWYSSLPVKPQHISRRNSLFYDLHAEARPLNLIP